jgi:hypothetical protein
MASLSTFDRARTPTLSALAASTGKTNADAFAARQHVLLGANSLSELVAMVPSNYREVLKPFLVEASSNAEKRVRAKETHAKLVSLKDRDPIQFPSHIAVKVHEVQLTKEFAATDEGRKAASDLAAANLSYKTALLDREISAKAENIVHLDRLLAVESFFSKMAPAILQRYSTLRLTHKVPKLVANTADGAEEGEIIVQSWDVSPALQAEYEMVAQDLSSYALRACAMVDGKAAAATSKIAAKKKLKESADVEMADATKPGPSIQSLVDRAVSAAVKKATSGPSKAKVSPLTLNYGSTAYPSITEARQSFVVEDHAGEFLRRGGRSTQIDPHGAPFFQYADPSVPEGQEGHSHRQQAGRQERRSSRKASLSGPPGPRRQGRRLTLPGQAGRQRQGEGSEGQQINVGGTSTTDVALFVPPPQVGGQRLRYDVPSSYPDWLLTIPYPTAINYLILNTPVNIVLASQFKDSIHCSPGVDIPREIELQLSVGARYMFRSPRNSQLIWDSWQDFVRRMRWRLFFAFQNNGHESYDPDYEVKKVSKKEPPVLPLYLEIGLRKGRHFVLNTIANIPSEETKEVVYTSLTPDSHRIGEFLVANDYVVTNTDKNLGIAVSKREWIEEKSLQLLADRNNYEPLNPLTATQILNKHCADAITCSELAENTSDGKQLSEFLRSNVTPGKFARRMKATDVRRYIASEPHKVPEFYGIPKIHKEPVKLRPIIPCYAAIQNPAAKYVSKKLKPLIQAAPTIIHGTKDLAIKLSTLDLDRSRKLWIVTGDVVAFYPNIPIQPCIDIIVELFTEYLNTLKNTIGADGTYYTGTEITNILDLFKECIRLANIDLITRFKDTNYKQTKGLAMGVACSPDLANLYGWFFERRSNILNRPNIPFYGRYIDDCFALVYAPTLQEAITTLENAVQFDGCVIEWGGGTSMPFLDMTLYIDRHGDLEHMPYRKARSHQERIPWISHHPLDVKRGAFIGDMSRLATLSSLHTHYQDAITALAGLYIKRGYPSDLVYYWISDNFTKRWNNRLVVKDPSDAADVLVLKTSFNTAWNYFNAHELGEQVLGYWRTWIEQAANDHYDINNGFGRMSGDLGGLSNVDPEFLTEVTTAEGTRAWIPDIRKLDILNRRMIVSRKRKRNLFDLTSLWKKLVLKRLDEEVMEHPQEVVSLPAQDRMVPSGVTTLAESIHRRDAAVPGDMEYINQSAFLVHGRNTVVDLDD